MRALAVQLVIAAGLVAARSVHADPAHDAADERNAKADQLFEAGRMLWKDDRHKEACTLFEESHELRPTSGTFANLAACARENRQWGLAWQRYNESARAAEQDGAADKADWARKQAAAVGVELCTADPSGVEVDITTAAGTSARRKLTCADAGGGATVAVVSAEDVTAVPPAASPQRRAADVNVGVGYFPRQVGTTLSFGATVGGWAWSQIAIDLRLAGGGFLAEQNSGREPGVIAFLGPSLRYAPVPALWLTAGAGVTGGWWSDGMGTTGALRPGFDLRACYWFTGTFNVSLEGFGFFDNAPSFGPISLLLGARLH
jgi:hypothetical protein